MKKLMILALVAGFTFGATSCKKDYTCTCSLDGDEIGSVTLPDVKKKDAKKACEGTATTFGGGEISCSLD